MAKKSRMGRNLDALLGGVQRSRSATSKDDVSSDEGMAVDFDQTGAATPGIESTPTPSAATPVTTSSRSPSEPAASHQQVSANDDRAPRQARTPTDPSPPTLAADPETALKSGDKFRMLGIDQIRRGAYQPRRLFDPELLQELAESLKSEGMIQPIIVRPFADAYELVAGERRWRAAQLAGMSEIPAIIREMEDRSVAAVSLIENIQRKDLNPLEEAAAFARLCDEFGMTHQQVASSVGRSRVAVTNLMRLLELHDEVKVMVDKGELETGHARAIVALPKEDQLALAERVVKLGMTSRAVENIVRDIKAGKEPKLPSESTISDPDIERLSQQLGEKLGSPVKIKHKRTGAGKLEINYGSVAELEGILKHFR